MKRIIISPYNAVMGVIFLIFSILVIVAINHNIDNPEKEFNKTVQKSPDCRNQFEAGIYKFEEPYYGIDYELKIYPSKKVWSRTVVIKSSVRTDVIKHDGYIVCKENPFYEDKQDADLLTDYKTYPSLIRSDTSPTILAENIEIAVYYKRADGEYRFGTSLGSFWYDSDLIKVVDLTNK